MTWRRRGTGAAVGHADGGGDRGAVTAELAVGLVAVTVVLLAVLATGAATITRMACVDAARTAARVAALGETDAAVRAAATRVLGARGGNVELHREDGWVTVTVSSPVTGWSAGMRAQGSATARVEP